MSDLHAAMSGFDITPRFHAQYGAWGTSPTMPHLDMPLRSRCLVLQQDERRVIWFGSDLVGETVEMTHDLRREVADAVDADVDQIIWSTSQSHSTGSIPGSLLSGSSITNPSTADQPFLEAERRRFVDSFINAARHGIDQLQPALVHTGRGHCDSISYNSRLPMPTGGCKFSRNYAEALQSGKFYDTAIGLLRFDDRQGKPIGLVFNFCCHPAVLIRNDHCSPDWVGSARHRIEEAIDGAPAMFVQGFCGDVHPRHMFGTCEQAAMLGRRLGNAAVDALPTLIPARAEPFTFEFKTIDIQCQPMPSREYCEQTIAQRQAFIDLLRNEDPNATWVCGYNQPDPHMFEPQARIASTRLSSDYFKETIRMLDAGEQPRHTLPLTLGAVRIGDVAAALSPGENFTITGRHVRLRSPFVHTLVCGDTGGLFGYIGNDEEIDRGGAETQFSWNILLPRGHCLPPAKGSAQRVINTLVDLLRRQRGRGA